MFIFKIDFSHLSKTQTTQTMDHLPTQHYYKYINKHSSERFFFYSFFKGKQETILITKMMYGVIISIYYDDDSILEINLEYINYRTATISTKIKTRDNDAAIKIKTFLEKINLPTDTDEYYELRNLFQDPETIHKYDNDKRIAIPQNPQILFDVWEQLIDMISPSEYVTK